MVFPTLFPLLYLPSFSLVLPLNSFLLPYFPLPTILSMPQLLNSLPDILFFLVFLSSYAVQYYGLAYLSFTWLNTFLTASHYALTISLSLALLSFTITQHRSFSLFQLYIFFLPLQYPTPPFPYPVHFLTSNHFPRILPLGRDWVVGNYLSIACRGAHYMHPSPASLSKQWYAPTTTSLYLLSGT